MSIKLQKALSLGRHIDNIDTLFSKLDPDNEDYLLEMRESLVKELIHLGYHYSYIYQAILKGNTKYFYN